jgi:9-cis-epoxycarotenoid dioxygenase
LIILPTSFSIFFAFSFPQSNYFFFVVANKTMVAFSSSFFSTLPQHSKITPILPLNVSNVRVEDKSQTTTTTTITRRPQPAQAAQPLKKQTNAVRAITQKAATKRPSSSTQQSTIARKPIELSLPTVILNAVDDFMNNFVDPPIRPSVDPKYVLSNNFAPVCELPPTECEVVEGSLPLCLDGAYIRNSPNPQYLPRGPYHLFDGDGMLHSIRISQGNCFSRQSCTLQSFCKDLQVHN